MHNKKKCIILKAFAWNIAKNTLTFNFLSCTFFNKMEKFFDST